MITDFESVLVFCTKQVLLSEVKHCVVDVPEVQFTLSNVLQERRTFVVVAVVL